MVEATLLDDHPNSLLVALRVRHQDADLCARKLENINQMLSGASGFSGLDVIRREGGLGTDFYLLIRFRSADALENWRNSPDRAAALVDIEALAITDISRQQAAGSNIWFEPISMPSTPRPPLLWKRWATSMLAVYPALIVLVYALMPITSRLPVPLGLFVVALVLTGLSTAFIVPWLTRRLHHWLIAR
tara:strand:- start:6111 stop:6677 length:567 start_codon:yes stop_codon:yes gene_type:complete